MADDDALTSENPESEEGAAEDLPSIRPLIAEAVDRLSHLSDMKIAWQVLTDLDESNWRYVVLPLVTQSVHAARRSTERAVEEKLREMPKAIGDPKPLARGGQALDLDPARKRANPMLMPPGRDRRLFTGRVLNRDLILWLRERREMLNEEFSLSDGSRVSWAKATLEQHEDRTAMLRKQIAGTSQTLALHVKAAQNIKTMHVKSLGELMDLVPEDESDEKDGE